MFNYLIAFFCVSFACLLPPLNAEETPFPFVSSYEQWVDPNNHFVDFFDDQARVIFIGSSAFSRDGQGIRPTVSEGMGYGLLLAYAYDDQDTFDKFLRYVLTIAKNEGCSLFDGTTCLAKAPFMMPWIVNEKGKPFWFLPAPDSPISYYSSGSATDADIQIAWAVYLASQKAAQGKWATTLFDTPKGKLNYQQLFQVMALDIRLNDIDLATLRYTPGSQWGAAGYTRLYPGYFTPEAFLALDTVAPPDTSSDCPKPFPSHSPINSLQLVFKNNSAKTISIDYMGGNGGVEVDANFVPKPGIDKGYTVAPVTTATAIFSSTNPYYASATIKATFYDEQGKPTRKSDYLIEYNHNQWIVTDQGSTKESKYYQSPSGNVVYLFLTDPEVHKITYKFADVLTHSLKTIQDFQVSHKTGLFPNVLYYDGHYPDRWSASFAYDACRFPLWAIHFLQMHPHDPPAPAIEHTLRQLLEAALPFIKQGTLPSEGINALTQEAIGDWNHPAPALNAPMMAAALGLGCDKMSSELSAAVFQYDITQHQPSSSDAPGDSSAYFNATILLLTRAVMEKRL